ncbi:MAG: hypothetical protein R2991_14130 [Thermoanaerobaculia bacterium]
MSDLPERLSFAARAAAALAIDLSTSRPRGAVTWPRIERRHAAPLPAAPMP